MRDFLIVGENLPAEEALSVLAENAEYLVGHEYLAKKSFYDFKGILAQLDEYAKIISINKLTLNLQDARNTFVYLMFNKENVLEKIDVTNYNANYGEGKAQKLIEEKKNENSKQK